MLTAVAPVIAAQHEASVDAAVAAERERIRQLAIDHGAVYFAEPRPCTCKPGCAVTSRERMPFAGLIGDADG
jgi:hypothetical protein